MKAVFRLLIAYFTGGVVAKWFTIAGIALILISAFVMPFVPSSEYMLAFGGTGVTALFLGSSLMPLTFGRLAQSQSAMVIPGLRLKLLISAILTVLLVALPPAVLTPLAFVSGMSRDVSDLASDPRLLQYTLFLVLLVYTSSCLIAAWMYVFLWFVTSRRDIVGAGKAMAVVLFLMVIPAREIREQGQSIVWNLIQMAGFALVFGTGFLHWPKIRQRLARWRSPAARTRSSPARDLTGKEIDLVLGNARPSTLIATLLLPLTAATQLGHAHPSVWVFFLTISSTVGGAITGQAPERSRALWLRGSWSRTELFAAVEKSSWRHNGRVLAALLLFFVIGGALAHMPESAFAVGIPSILLGSALSTYLGLSLTRGIRWFEGTAAVLVMVGLMAVALDVSVHAIHDGVVVAILVALAVFAVVLRQSARKRWMKIDWLECRVTRQRDSRLIT